MRSLPKLLSIFLALLMLLSVFTVAPISASAADETEQSTVVDETKTAKAVDSVVKTAEDETDESDPSDSSESDPTDETVPDETLPAGDMAAPKSMTVEKIDLFEDLDSHYVKSYDDYENEHAWASYEYADQIECKVTLEDDTVLTSDEDGIITYNGVEFTVDCMDDQSWETPWSTGNHEVTYSILGLETTAVVNVQESPISKVEFEDITCVEGTNGYLGSYYSWDDETEQSVFDKAYFYYNDEPKFTVYLKNGETVKSENGSVELLGKIKSADVNTMQYAEPWQVGTRKVSAILFGKEYKFNYTITESDIKSIRVKDVTVRDGVDSSLITYYMDGEKYTYKEFNYNPEIEITLKDNSVVTKYLDDEEITVGDVTYRINNSDDQDDDNEWGAGVHRAFVFVGAQNQEIKVTVIESPIVGLTISDVEIYRGIDCNPEYDWDYEGFYNEYVYTPEFSVKLANGSTVKGHNGSVTIDGYMYKLNYEDDQSYESQWEPGNSYTVTGSIGSLTDDFTVTINSNPVKSVKVIPETVTATKGVDSYFTVPDDESEEPYERINYEKYVSLEITMFDGTVVTEDDNGDYYYNDINIPIEFIDNQSKDNVWGVGTYSATVSVLGTTAPVTVNVKGTPAKKVDISKITIIEGTHKSEDGSKYEYMPKFTVTLSNGETYESDVFGGIEYNDDYFYLNIEDDQSSENPWGVGTHTATGTILGVSAEFEVEVVPSPVKKVEAEPLKLIENASGDWEYEYKEENEEEIEYKYFGYYTYPVQYTVTLNDDTVLESDFEGGVLYDGEWYYIEDITDNQSYDNQWTVGNTYTCTANVLGFAFEYQATVTGTPVVSAQIDDLIVIDQYDCETMYDDDGNEWTRYDYNTGDASITVKLDDDTVIHGEYGTIFYNGEYYELTDIDDGQGPDNQWEVGGTYSVKAKILGFDTTFNVKVIENPIKSVKINDVFKITEFDEDYGDYDSYYDDDDNYVGDYFYYNPAPVNYTVTFKDGAVMKSDEEGFIEYMGKYYGLWFNYQLTDQDYYNQWKAGGTYTAVATIMGFDVEYDVTILSKASASATTVKVKAKKSVIYVGGTTTVTATVTNPVGTTKFKSSNKKVATVDSKGKVKGLKAGKVKITATNNGKSHSVTINVIKKKNTAKIKVSAKTVKYTKLLLKSQTVKAIAVKKPQGKVTYAKKKGDKKITVNKKTGKITLKKGMKKGKYTIKVKVKVAGNKKYKPLTKTVTVKITVK